MGTLALSAMGCLGCCCCWCCRSSRHKADSLDAYAPRSQSIVWPPLPEETACVLE
ncbi:CG4763, partial [Drosophila busckii]